METREGHGIGSVYAVMVHKGSGRVTHAVGLSASGGASIARSIGMTLTWLAYVFLIAATLFTAVA